MSRIEVVEILLDAGADVNAEDEDGYTPLYKLNPRGYWSDIEEVLKMAGGRY